MTVLIFLIVLAILIFVHELGHFLFARACDIRVDAFALGFGPKIVSWQKGETVYTINLIPFGGYVKIFGENPDEESIGGPDSARSFVNKSRPKQALVLFAGVLFNFIFAWLLYTVVFTNGVTATAGDFTRYKDYLSNQRIMITSVMPGSPADKIGLKIGDVFYDVKNIEDIQNAINSSNGSNIDIKYIRNNEVKNVAITPIQGIVNNKYAIGIGMDNVADMRLPFFVSVWESLRYTWVMIKGTISGLYGFLIGILHGTAKLSEVSGPIGIAGIIGDAANLGFTYLVMMIAIISINLGVINLVPFPALDGGRILFVFIESIIRRRIPVRFANIVNTVGFALLMALMVLVTYKDIAKLIH